MPGTHDTAVSGCESILFAFPQASGPRADAAPGHARVRSTAHRIDAIATTASLTADG
jgi:hypothetical protein